MEGDVWADGTSADKEISWTIALGIVQVPVAVLNLHYNGKEQTGVLEGAGYTLTNNKATEIGTYTATATLADAAKYIWSDGTNIYYSYGTNQYVLNGDTWEAKTWNGLTKFYASGIWTDGTNIYYSYNTEQYILQKDE